MKIFDEINPAAKRIPRTRTEVIKSRLQEWLSHRGLLVIIFVGFAVYFNALFNGFVFDDIPQVVNNPWIRHIRYVPDIFFENVWGFVGKNSNYYRPMMHVGYMLSYLVFGLKAWGYHLTNIVLHVLISILVYLIICRFLKSSPNQAADRIGSPAFWAAVLFAAHPIHTEVVASIMGISDLSFTLFYLLSFYFYIRGKEGAAGAYMLSVLSFFMALLCKEPALTLPVILIVYDFAIAKEKVDLRSCFRRYGSFAVITGIYISMRFLSLGGFFAGTRQTQVSSVEYLINIFPLFKQYLEMLILPVNLNVLHAFRPIHSLYEPKGLLSLGVALIFGAGVWIAWKRTRMVFLGLLMLVLPLLPALYIPGLNQELENAFAERYLYLPSFGFALLSALLIEFAMKDGAKRTVRQGLYAGLGGLLLLYSIGTIERNVVWKNQLALFEDAVRKSPNGAYGHIYLGQAYSDEGNLDKAIEHFLTAIRLNPKSASAHNNLGLAYDKKGLENEAIDQFRIAISLKPLSGVYVNLGVVYSNKGFIDEAIKQYQTAIKLKPDSADAYVNLGIAYGEKGMIDQAIECLETAVTLNPIDPHAHHNLANAYRIKGLLGKAQEHLQKARDLQLK